MQPNIEQKGLALLKTLTETTTRSQTRTHGASAAPVAASANVTHLTTRLGYQFQNHNLLIEAITHSSAGKTKPSPQNPDQSSTWNERLEFLGDSVLGLVISGELLRHPDCFAEGDLSKIRASLVNSQTLAVIAKSIDLGEALILGKSEEKSRGRQKNSLLADALEALLGAIYLDAGFKAAEKVILRLYAPILAKPLHTLIERDYKSRLQELTQEYFRDTPQYDIVQESGPDHDRTFEMEVSLKGLVLGRGHGVSKKAASQAAAMAALEKLGGSPDLLNRLLQLEHTHD